MRCVNGMYAVLMAVTLVFSAHLAYAQSFSGTTGTNSVGTTSPVPATPQQQVPAPVVTNVPPSLPPVFQGETPVVPQVPVVPQAPVAVPGQLDASALPTDPCAAYLNSYDMYAVCQDRVKRLDRMKELKERRAAEAEARRQAIEDRKKAEEEAARARANQPKMRRPGQVAPAPKQPQQVQIVPVDDAAKKK